MLSMFLFFLPFQLVDLFQWYTIPGVAIASFIYLGFLAAGEEIEQPFGEHTCLMSTDVFHSDNDTYQVMMRTISISIYSASKSSTLILSGSSAHRDPMSSWARITVKSMVPERK